MVLYDYNIYSIIKYNAKMYGENIAWIAENQKITHQQFKEKVDRLSCGLLKLGLEKGDRIGVLARNSMEFIYLYGASAKIGTIMLPINWRLKQKEVEHVILDGSPKIMFVGEEFQSLIESLISKLNSVERYFVLGKNKGDGSSFHELMENNGDCPDLDILSSDPYVILSTAAVAGRQRGAILTHQGLIAINLQTIHRLNLTERDRHLCMLPLFHLAGLGASLNIMHAGGLNIIMSNFDAEFALKHIQENKITFFIEFTPMLATLLDKAQEANYDLSSLRLVLGLDHPETAKRFEEMTKATFWAAYGQSEISGIISLATYFERPGSEGLPGFMTEVEIMDDHGNILETGETGEIVVRGPMVFKGYWNLEKDNEYTFRYGWHHTGDIGRLDEDGYLWHMGRMPEKELIKSGGENIYPGEVEKAILEHQLVEEVSVIGVSDKKWGEAIKAVCVLKEGEYLTGSELIEFVASRIGPYKKPKHVVFVFNLPKTENGSIDRQKVKMEYGEV